MKRRREEEEGGEGRFRVKGGVREERGLNMKIRRGEEEEEGGEGLE